MGETGICRRSCSSFTLHSKIVGVRRIVGGVGQSGEIRDHRMLDVIEMLDRFVSATVGVAGDECPGNGAMSGRRLGHDALYFRSVLLGSKERVEFVGAEQLIEHLAIQLDEEWVVAAGGDGGVEFAIEAPEVIEFEVLVELASEVSDLGSGVVVGSAGSELEDRDFEEAPGFEEIGDERGMRCSLFDLDIGQVFSDVGTIPPALDDAHRNQTLHGFPHRRAGDGELL